MYITIHNAFLVLIATNQIFTSGYVVYNYINKGTIEFFKRILENIVKRIDSTSNVSEDVLYMRKYHYITIKKLYNFMTWISGKLGAKDVVDIRRCEGNVYDCFILFNYFKTVLESYNEMFQNKITIYARINDIGYDYDKDYDASNSSAKNTYEKQVFVSDYEHKILDTNDKKPVDTAIMWVEANNNTCPPLVSKQTSKLSKNTENEYKFTEVFDSVNFPSNGDISKYMTIDTQIAKGKGVAVMTYGYSGTGKTFTLFGSRDIGKEGVLQATLNGINGLKKLEFRLYEIFGYGMAYPHYWTSPDGSSRMSAIDNRIYHYKLTYDNAGNLTFDNVIRYNAKQIGDYTNNRLGTGTTYFEISKDLALNVLRNFDSFIGQVENYREGKDSRKTQFEGTDFVPRVEKTPNNRVSSRSVILYDFQIYLEDLEKPVPFIIIDLPGREEIIQTYIDPYVNSPVIRNILKLTDNGTLNNKYYELEFLLSVMALNPIAVPLFYNKIYEFINKKYKYILEERLPFKFPLNKSVENTDSYTHKSHLEDIKIKYDVEQIDGNYFVTNPKSQNGFKFAEELFNRVGSSIDGIITGINPTYKGHSFGFGYDKHSYDFYQLEAVLSIHVMNRLLMLNKFDIIKEIYEIICKKFINSTIDKYVDDMTTSTEIYDTTRNLLDTRFKGERVIRSEIPEFQNVVKTIVNQTAKTEISKTDFSIIKAELKSILEYDYYLTPFTGIYINENIIGLIKYLASKMITEESERKVFLEDKIHKQNDKLDFSFQQKVCRVWLMSDPSVTPGEIQSFYNFENISDVPLKLLAGYSTLHFDIENMKSEYIKVRESYHSNYIFNFEQPLITEILDPYITKINDYKVFYLFGNYKDLVTRDLKCEHQVNLLNSTADFINIITGKI